MTTLDTLLQKIDEVIVNPLIFLMFAAALAVFLWGVIQFIGSSDSEEGRNTGKRHILWGIIGMFIMVSAFGIINIIVNTFGINTSAINSVRK